MAGRLGDRAGYAGSWDTGVSLSGLKRSAAAPTDTGRLADSTAPRIPKTTTGA
jgi:hypothetical protein